MKYLSFVVVAIYILGLSSCSGTKVVRTDEDEVIDLSGNWNETDSLLVSNHMVKDLLNNSWHSLFARQNNRKPVVQLGKILNKTSEHIATDTFARDIELALGATDEVILVASGAAKSQVRVEREDYRIHNEHPGGTRIYREKETDFILGGAIHSIVDQLKETKVIYYQVDLELVAVSNNEKVWIGQKRIKKVIEKPLVKW